MKVTRRSFAMAGMFTSVTSRRVSGANDRIRVGVIGVGGRANLLIDQLPDTAEVVAVADCWVNRCQEAAAKRNANWRIYKDHRKLLEQKDIDGVIVATPDHDRVYCCIHALEAGKDIYAEKPLTAYIEEGRVLVRATRKYNRIVQVGSQQRSMAMNKLGCDFVRTGGLGRLLFVQGVNYQMSAHYSGLPEEPAPEGLDWDVWQGPVENRPYNKKLHRYWMHWWAYSGGEMTNWGAHGIDQIQSALGMSTTGPVEFWPLTDIPWGSEPHYDKAIEQSEPPTPPVGFRYSNGVTVRLEMPAGRLNGGAIFVGEKGRMELIRNDFHTDPPGMVKKLPPRSEVDKWRDDVAKWQAKYHMEEWLQCMRSRKLPSADVEIGHRSVSVCHLVNITRQLKRKLQWDPEAERFVGDSEADKYLSRPRRKGYELPKV